ncbi:MAG: type II toxin-antitoxin system RelE/ParE family toxin [Methylococcales bacterium]|nr:type II toxin-antitoxin system RelE/ParE family toxin [Methylococcales bacterium]
MYNMFLQGLTMVRQSISVSEPNDEWLKAQVASADKLSKKARADLQKSWLYGVKTHGNQRADQYQQGVLDRFAQIAEQPYLIRPCAGYRRSVYGADSIY